MTARENGRRSGRTSLIASSRLFSGHLIRGTALFFFLSRNPWFISSGEISRRFPSWSFTWANFPLHRKFRHKSSAKARAVKAHLSVTINLVSFPSRGRRGHLFTEPTLENSHADADIFPSKMLVFIVSLLRLRKTLARLLGFFFRSSPDRRDGPVLISGRVNVFVLANRNWSRRKHKPKFEYSMRGR